MRRSRSRSTVRRCSVAVATVVAVVLGGCSSSGDEPAAAPTADELAAAVDGFVDESLSPGIRNRRAILVAVDGETMVERYHDSSAEETAAIASVTKSFVGTLVGIAVDEDLLTLDDTLRELLPDHADLMTPEVGGITARQLLTMTAGFPSDENADPGPFRDDWVAGILRKGIDRPPGESFVYSNASSHLLAAILTEVTGRPLLAYAREVLLDPLGIDTRPAFQPRVLPGQREPVRAYTEARFAWPRDPQGINVGFGFAKMGAEDMLALGNLYLDEGVRDGEQLVPGDWVEEATTSAVEVPAGFGGEGYGYQWWVTTAGEHDAYAAIGFGGQIVEVVPDLRLVVVASTWIDDTTTFDSRIWQTMVSQSIVPLFGQES